MEAAVIRNSPPAMTPQCRNTQTSTRAHATARIAVSSSTAIKRSPNEARRGMGKFEAESVPRIGTTMPDSSSMCCPGGTFTPHQLQRRNFGSTVLLQRGHSMGGLGWAYHNGRYLGFAFSLRHGRTASVVPPTHHPLVYCPQPTASNARPGDWSLLVMLFLFPQPACVFPQRERRSGLLLLWLGLRIRSRSRCVARHSRRRVT